MPVFDGVDVLGVIGAALIILTYFLLQLKKLEGTSLTYTGLNALGALLILTSLLFNFNLASFIIECFWLAISLFGIVMALRGR
ncbi:MAG: hypothetical protein EP347_04910 [Alphaproteobacteria bacterium]|nr:MAG: hypothetical protein EP347_04910 [Alphaproteobacteria bacterium]